MKRRVYSIVLLIILGAVALYKNQFNYDHFANDLSNFLKLNKYEKANEMTVVQTTVPKAYLKNTNEPVHKLVMKEKSKVAAVIESEAKRLYNTDSNPENTNARLRLFAKTLDNSELNELTLTAINENVEFDQRNLAVYLLTLAGPAAQESLLNFFFNPSNILNQTVQSHSIQEIQQNNEISIRTMALEAIERNLHQTKKTFLTSEKLKNSYLSGLLKIVRLGEKMQKPMLKEFIDQKLDLEKL